jgi:DNA topoisomerase-1
MNSNNTLKNISNNALTQSNNPIHNTNHNPHYNNNQKSDEANFNKRQFWPYQRFYSKTAQDRAHRARYANVAKNTKIVKQEKKTKRMFHLVNNKITTDKDLIKRLEGIYIPPAYTDIVIAKSANNKIQAIGTDNRGRRQYIYNPNFIKKRNDRKYDDILELAKKITSIENDNHAMLQSLARKNINEWYLPEDLIPIIVYMLRTYHFRIGNQRYVDANQSYGITTLRKEHIKWHPSIPNRFTIEFIGKKGILNRYTDENALMARLLSHLCDNCGTKSHGGQSCDFLFKYRNANTGAHEFITPDQVQGFFQNKYNAYITPKMFRTWYGNYHLLVALRDMFNRGELKHRLKSSEKNDVIRKCSEHVSSKLNNTPTVSRQSYIDNKILELMMRNPYRLSSLIPDTDEGRHRFLYKIITKLRSSN